MPLRNPTRDQAWLLPPDLGDLVPPDHPVRFVATFVDLLEPAAWAALGIVPTGAARGAPAYAPALLLGVWIYGFLTGLRSTRQLEAACREQVPLLWLTGLQPPDHNTLHRFYLAHRTGLRKLLKRTVRTAIRLGLVDLAFQAVDGTKVGAAAARDRMLTEAQLAALLERTDPAITALEAQARSRLPRGCRPNWRASANSARGSPKPSLSLPPRTVPSGPTSATPIRAG